MTFDARSASPGSVEQLAGPDGRVIASRLTWARSRHERRRGLLDRPPLQTGEGLVIERAFQVHTFGMRYSIDVLFCDGRWIVRHVVNELEPRRLTKFVLRSRFTVELPAGTARGLRAGDQMRLLNRASDTHD